MEQICVNSINPDKKHIIIESECLNQMSVDTIGTEHGVPSVYLKAQIQDHYASIKLYGFETYTIQRALIHDGRLIISLEMQKH